MSKRVSDNQDAGYNGETAFSCWASSIGWYATKIVPDHGLDFLCQIRGKRTDAKSAEMTGNLLTVSVRSTTADSDAITITRDDADLFLKTNVPLVFALVRRGSPGEMSLVAIKFPDEAFVRELDAFMRSSKQSHQVRFSDAVTDISEIRCNAERLFKESYTDLLTRLRATLRVESLLPDPHVEIIHDDIGSYAVVRSKEFLVPVDISERPEVADALKDIGLPFRTLLPLVGHGLEVAGVTYAQTAVLSKRPLPLIRFSVKNGKQQESAEQLRVDKKPSLMPLSRDNVTVLVDRVRQELAVWNYDNATALAMRIEAAFISGAVIDGLVAPGIFVLLARVHISRAETKHSEAAYHIDRAKALLGQAEGMLVGDFDRLAETFALRASLKSLERGLDAALALLEGRSDPYAVRTRVALLLNQHKAGDALRIIEGMEPHERWCDVAVTVYVLNDQLEKAQAIVRWAAGLPDRNRHPQCVVRMAEAMMAQTFAGHAQGGNILPKDVTSEERDKLDVVLMSLRSVLEGIGVAGRPTSELDMSVLRIAWQANHLLQRRKMVAEFLGLMNAWTPVPVDVARGVISGYIEAPPDLPERLRRDHPGDLEANILAAMVQSSALGQHSEAFAKAKDLVPLADSNEKKEELFRLFQQVWQNLEGPEVSACEAITGPLVAHNPQLHSIFEAAVLLRKGDADGAIGALEREKAEDDPYWLQLRANALIAKRDLGGAVEFLLMAAKKTFDAMLLQKTGDLAYTAKQFDVAVWCYERLIEIQPGNVAVRGNLAHIYTFELYDFEKAAVQFRALHAVEPDNPTHTFNLAICLARLFHPEESLSLYDELCRQDKPTMQVVLGRAQLHHSLGHPEKALASLNPFRDHFWNDPGFVMAFMTAAHAAGDENAAHDALKALNQMREAGKIKPEAFRPVHQDEALEMFKQSFKQTQDRTEYLHAEMLKGRMPWVWAEQVSNNAIYWGWRERTHEMGWIDDEPTNRAHFCIYATNGFNARESERGHRELLPLECPPVGTKVVADLSALITLHRLGLLDMAAEYFGEVLVPAGYLPTVLEDSRKMVLNQRSQQQNAEQIVKKVNSGSIVVLEEGANSQFPIVDEFGESADHRYRLTDIVRPIHDAGIVSDTEFGRISPVCAKPSAVDETHPALGRLQDVAVDLSTLETLAHFGLLDTITNFYRVNFPIQAHREILQRLEAIAYQEETRGWHMDLWNHLRGDPRFRFVPHTVPEQIRKKDTNPKDYLPFLASFVAQETNTPLLADDRVCQAFTLNEVQNSAHAAFGTDVLVLALMTAGKLNSAKATAAIRQLMQWRYRFIVPSPEALKAMADQYRASPPGQALQDVAEYVHDCMRDSGLFSGPEKTDIGDSMAMRFYLEMLSTVAEFLILVWADDGFAAEPSARLTEWSVRELLPSIPRVVAGQARVLIGALTNRLFLSHALLKTGAQFGNPRMADAMKALKEALRLDNDEYIRIVTEILRETARTMPQS